MFSPQWLEGSFFLLEGLASDDTWSARPNAQPRTWMAGGLFSFLSGLLLMTSGLPSEGPTFSLAFRIMKRSGCAVSRSGCAVGVRSGCAVGSRSGCAVGSRSGCAVGVRSGCAVGVRSGCVVGVRSGCAVGVRSGCAVGLRSGCAVGLRSGVCPSGVQKIGNPMATQSYRRIGGSKLKTPRILWQLGVTVGLGAQNSNNPMATRSYRRIGGSKLQESYGNSELP